MFTGVHALGLHRAQVSRLDGGLLRGRVRLAQQPDEDALAKVLGRVDLASRTVCDEADARRRCGGRHGCAGRHARAAPQLGRLASGDSAEFTLRKDSQPVNGKSIMGVMMLAAGQGSTVEANAEGEDAAELLDALGVLI